MSSEADDAILALLEAGSVKTYDSYVTDSDNVAKTISAPLPYLVYYTSPGYPINPRMAPTKRRAQEFQITYVGKTREQAVWAADKAEAALAGARITIGGRSRLIRRTDDYQFVRRDDTWNRPDGGPLFTGVLRFVVDY